MPTCMLGLMMQLDDEQFHKLQDESVGTSRGTSSDICMRRLPGDVMSKLRPRGEEGGGRRDRGRESERQREKEGGHTGPLDC